MPGLNVLKSQKNDFIELGRFVITRKTSFKNFRAIVHVDLRHIAAYKSQYYFKTVIKKILGNMKYYKIWNKFFREV